MGKTITQQFTPIPIDELVFGVRIFKNKSLLEKRVFIQRLVAAHPILNLQWGPGHRFRRARRLSGKEVAPDHVNGVAWRSQAPATQGRANPSGFPVIYLADKMETAFREVIAEADRTVIAEFTIMEHRAIRIAPIGEMGLIQRSGRGWLSGNASSEISHMLNACAPDAAKSLLVTDTFLFDCLTNAEDDYDISSTVATCIFDKIPAVTAIAYPSRRQHGAINLAVRTDSFWDNWGIVSIQCGLATHLACGYYRFSDRRHVTGITRSGVLRWDAELLEDHSTIILDPPWTPASQQEHTDGLQA